VSPWNRCLNLEDEPGDGRRRLLVEARMTWL
jgi:hypothetical protein